MGSGTVFKKKFPSPQGGSETDVGRGYEDPLRSFHPLKAGRRPERWSKPLHEIRVFPSPQGGSETPLIQAREQSETKSFHPLKAGRRLALSIQVGEPVLLGFHPLKAGRRPSADFAWVVSLEFPSPQGGSETKGK